MSLMMRRPKVASASDGLEEINILGGKLRKLNDALESMRRIIATQDIKLAIPVFKRFADELKSAAGETGSAMLRADYDIALTKFQKLYPLLQSDDAFKIKSSVFSTLEELRRGVATTVGLMMRKAASDGTEFVNDPRFRKAGEIVNQIYLLLDKGKKEEARKLFADNEKLIVEHSHAPNYVIQHLRDKVNAA